MKKRNIIKKNNDFFRIINKNKCYKTSSYIIYIEKKEQDKYHFGISVSKKIGNAVIRNKIKRQIKNMVDKKSYLSCYNIVIIVRKNYLKNNYNDNEKILFDAFNNLKILYEEANNEK